MRLFRFAADRDNVQALSMYGHLLHFRGEGVANRIQGGLYIERAAKQGDAKSQYQVGRIYEYGFEHYFKVSAETAFEFYNKAAVQGHLLATKRLVKAFERGELTQAADAAVASHWRLRLEQIPAMANLNAAIVS